MTHVFEHEIEPRVAEWFEQEYGETCVETQVYQPETQWYCDIVVDVGFGRLYIEVENDSGSVRSGIAQALGYAAQDSVAGIPMVVTPVGHLDRTRVDRLRQNTGCLVREFDEEALAFTR